MPDKSDIFKKKLLYRAYIEALKKWIFYLVVL